jgi:tape measure domain-containing protein
MTDLVSIGFKADTRDLKQAGREFDSLSRKGDDLDRSTNKMSRSFVSAKTAALALGSAIGAIGVTQLVRSAADATNAMDAINSSLRVATGSAQGAAREFAFVSEQSQRLGIDLRSSAEAYASLAAAAKGTALEGEASRDIFRAVAEAMSALGRDAYDTEGALRAIEQMISKGNVSAEELRGQLGERLPGAFNIAARSIGVTTEELNKMLQNGELLAEDLLPALASELSNTFSAEAERRATSLQGQMNNFRSAVFELMSSGNMQGLADAIGDFTDLIKDPGFQKGFSSLLSGLVSIAELSGKVASGFGQVGTMIGETTARLMGYETIVDQIISKEDELTRAQYQLSRARTETAKQSAQERIDSVRSELDALRDLHAMQLMTNTSFEEGAKASADFSRELQNLFSPLSYIEEASKGAAAGVRELSKTIDTSSMMWDWSPVKGEFDKELNKAMKDSKQIMDDWAPKLFEEFPEEAERYTDESVDVFQTAWERGIERVDDMFAGLWDSVFNGFEDFGSTLKRSFTGLLAELAHAAITRPISLQFQQAFSGGAGMAAGTAGAGAMGGMGGSATSIVGAIQQGLAGGNAAIVEGIENIGIDIAFSSDSELFQGIGNFLFDQSQLIADVLPYAGAALSLIQGDIKGAALQGAGVAIGSALGGPIGGAIGGALGSVVSGLFGDDPELAGNIARYRRGGNTSQSNYGDNLGAQKGVDQLAGYVGSRIDLLLDSIESDATYNLGVVFSQRTNTRGGLFMGPHVPLGGKYNNGGFEKFAQDVMNKGFSKFIQVLDIPSEVKKLFKGVNDDEVADALLGGVSRLSQSQEEVAERFGITRLETIRMANASGLAKTEMAGLINSITDAAAGSRTLGEQLLMIRGNLEQVYGGELPQTLDEYDEALKAVDTTTKEGIRTFYQLFSLRGTFEDYRAGINELKGAVSGAVFGLLSPTEQLKQMRANTESLFEEFGLQVPRTVQDLVQIASGIDYMTEEGLNLASVFPALVDAFTRTREQADLLAGSLINASEFGNVVDFRRARALNQNGIPGFADGGYHSGGLRIVGENGPEVEATGPSRIFNQDQLINLQPLLAEIQSLRAEVNQLRSDSSDTARNTRTTADLLQRVSRDGESILTESVA